MKDVTPKPTGKRYHTIAAMLRDMMGKKAEPIIKAMECARAKDRREAKKLGISLLDYQRCKMTHNALKD
jgi:hypothetical protein